MLYIHYDYLHFYLVILWQTFSIIIINALKFHWEGGVLWCLENILIQYEINIKMKFSLIFALANLSTLPAKTNKTSLENLNVNPSGWPIDICKRLLCSHFPEENNNRVYRMLVDREIARLRSISRNSAICHYILLSTCAQNLSPMPLP